MVLFQVSDNTFQVAFCQHQESQACEHRDHSCHASPVQHTMRAEQLSREDSRSHHSVLLLALAGKTCAVKQQQQQPLSIILSVLSIC